VKTDDLDNLAAETCAYMTIVHPDYSKLAARIAISNLHKRTSASFFEVSHRLYTNIKDKFGRPAPMLADDVYAVIEKYQDKIQKVLDFNRDFNYDYFGFKTLERSYLMKDGK
jgi:ribonucleotide reductase alpha subunit